MSFVAGVVYSRWVMSQWVLDRWVFRSELWTRWVLSEIHNTVYIRIYWTSTVQALQGIIRYINSSMKPVHTYNVVHIYLQCVWVQLSIICIQISVVRVLVHVDCRVQFRGFQPFFGKCHFCDTRMGWSVNKIFL